jgi:GntR family transcriptional regulator
MNGPNIYFRLDPRSGVPAYRQLSNQVRQALDLGLLVPGDQLPPVREVVKQVLLNPNTVHRAYRELESIGLVEGIRGRGTYVSRTAASTGLSDYRSQLEMELIACFEKARNHGLNEESIMAHVCHVLRSTDGTKA